MEVPKESKESLFKRICEPLLPLNEYIPESNQYVDSSTSIHEVLSKKIQNQYDLILSMKTQIESLTRIINVITLLNLKCDKRKLTT